MSAVLTVIAVIIALLLGLMISRSMSGTIHLTSKRNDEFALLCEGVNEMVGTAVRCSDRFSGLN